MTKLVNALVTHKNCFNIRLLKSLTGATLRRSRDGSYSPFPYRKQYKEIQSIGIRELKSGGKKLYLAIDTFNCSINRSDCKSALNDKMMPTIPKEWIPYVANKEVYSVPSGMLILSWYKSGFKSLQSVSLYSHEAKSPI